MKALKTEKYEEKREEVFRVYGFFTTCLMSYDVDIFVPFFSSFSLMHAHFILVRKSTKVAVDFVLKRRDNEKL